LDMCSNNDHPPANKNSNSIFRERSLARLGGLTRPPCENPAEVAVQFRKSNLIFASSVQHVPHLSLQEASFLGKMQANKINVPTIRTDLLPSSGAMLQIKG